MATVSPQCLSQVPTSVRRKAHSYRLTPIAACTNLIDAGFDIFNPIQCSAAGMDSKQLKQKFGDRITFWGGSVDTQHTLPFGSPDEVHNEVCKRIGTFAPGCGYVFNAIHNIQAATPIENVLAMVASIHEFGTYPIQR